MNAMLANESLITNGVWPIYPELKELMAANFPVSTHFILPEGLHSEVISREVFVQRSIETYNRSGYGDIAALGQATDALELIQRVVG